LGFVVVGVRAKGSGYRVKGEGGTAYGMRFRRSRRRRRESQEVGLLGRTKTSAMLTQIQLTLSTLKP
jgi:hypothetical protein